MKKPSLDLSESYSRRSLIPFDLTQTSTSLRLSVSLELDPGVRFLNRLRLPVYLLPFLLLLVFGLGLPLLSISYTFLPELL